MLNDGVRRLLALSVFLVSMQAIVGNAQQILGQPYPVLDDWMNTYITDLLSRWNSSGGVGVAVVRRVSPSQWQVETRGYGKARYDGTPVTEETLFSIGSNTKLFNILATGLLISNESLSPRITWNTKLASVIPGWKLLDPVASTGTTILDAMSHRTGLPRHDHVFHVNDSIPDVIRHAQSLRSSGEFRESFQYTNLMYNIISYLPTVLLPGRPSFARYVKENIFQPLGLNSTTFSFEAANKTGKLADGMDREDVVGLLDDGPARAIPYWSQTGGEDGNVMSGAAGIISNAVDMAIWLQTLLQDGVNPRSNVSVIPKEVLTMTSTGITVGSGTTKVPFLSPSVYGGGQWQNTYRGHVLIEHDGSVPGFNSIVSRLPFEKIGIAVLTNDDQVGDVLANIIKYRIVDLALGMPPLNTEKLYLGIAQSITNAQKNLLPRPPDATPPSRGFATLAGLYENPAYGRIEFCYASLATNDSSKAPPSNSCRDLVNRSSTILPGVVESGVPTFLARWDRVFGKYVALKHFNGDLFNVTVLNSYPTGNTSRPFWAGKMVDDRANARFVADDQGIGLAMINNFWSASKVGSPEGRTIREKAEVWFEKVG
ncbi:hypothetical protein HGRIS_005051 [Hohenbuehelia grisea]|uniref:Beta-lactamase-related domain-containing protein n=1 Tax=Hohenbuehelia grisea TaxID=104357 RepID=A0ABR3JE15_9AGAR